MKQIGIIDLGSNTARLIIMAYQPNYSFQLLDEVSERVRLVEGVGLEGQLQGKPVRRAVETLKMFNALCRATAITAIVPVATSAVREASNQAAFLQKVETETGLRLRVLSGKEEAYYGYLGVVNSLSFTDGCVVDIGGGSTEVASVRNRELVQSVSHPAGIVRFTERFVHSDPISSEDFKALEQGAENVFREITWLDATNGPTMVAVGGTARSIAHIHQKATGYPLDRVHAYAMHRDDLDGMVDSVRGMSQHEREQMPGLSRHRSDVFLAGAVLLRQLMRQGGFEQLVISGQGLREGLFYEHFLQGQEQPLFNDLRSFSVQNLANRYDVEPRHVAKVRELSLAMFDQLTPLHEYGTWERELLGHAATLHDIGVSVDYYDHHKHSAYLLMNSSLGGFSHREIIIITLLARFHQKGDIFIQPFGALLQPDDESRIARLTALLRVAENLERSKNQIVQRVRIVIKSDKVLAMVTTSGDATVELWNANRRTGLFRKSFGHEIEIMNET